MLLPGQVKRYSNAKYMLIYVGVNNTHLCMQKHKKSKKYKSNGAKECARRVKQNAL